MPQKDDHTAITFHERLAPALAVGTYRISVETEFPEGSGLPKSFGKAPELFIQVGGKRFNFSTADVDSVYPPANGQGKYESVLPHIVFHDKGLPWQRRMGSGADEDIPWLALLLLDQDDPAPKVREMRLGDLPEEASESDVYFPGFRLEPGEDPDTICHYFDLPWEKFEALKPTLEELKLLAHSREVNMFPKANGSLEQDETHTYSLVIGNRLPRPGSESVVHLVSYENYQKVFDKKWAKELAADCHSIRLLSLRSWRFTTDEFEGSFKGYFSALNNGQLGGGISSESPLQLHYPFSSTPKPKKDDYSDPRTLLAQGFFPMEHRFRHGANGVSWYRGPLTPAAVNQLPQLQPPFSSADALLIYDPLAGQFDVSYAAAWQLGQLLGLKNKSFAKALYFWKQQNAINDRKNLERTLLKEQLPLQEATSLAPDFNTMLAAAKETKNPDTEKEALPPAKADTGLQDRLVEKAGTSDSTQLSKQSESSGWYATVRDLVQSLRVLRPVPYNYLVPNEKYLPPESIRFFEVDPNWVNALVDGACSIGDLVPERTVRLPEENESGGKTRYYGFLLRSRMITIWPGVEIFFNDGPPQGESEKSKHTYTPVRHERLAEDLIISILAVPIDKVEFRLPPEGLHFGIEVSEEKKKEQNEAGEEEQTTVYTYQKKIRKKGIDSAQWETAAPFAVSEDRRVSIGELSESLGSDSASFAYQMVENPAAVRLKLKKNK
ncbi:MAG: hypothetical protein GYB31_09700 [Bacteroidetes bacterium]|nr:hypothetical protein [Bacteroidota bacterium]